MVSARHRSEDRRAFLEVPRVLKALPPILALVPVLASSQTRIDSVSNPGVLSTANPQVGAHNVLMHFSTLLIVGVAVPLWGMFALMIVREAYSWFDRVIVARGGGS